MKLAYQIACAGAGALVFSASGLAIGRHQRSSDPADPAYISSDTLESPPDLRLAAVLAKRLRDTAGPVVLPMALDRVGSEDVEKLARDVSYLQLQFSSSDRKFRDLEGRIDELQATIRNLDERLDDMKRQQTLDALTRRAERPSLIR